MTTTLQSLLVLHRNAGIIISGDKNEIDVSELLLIDPSLRQLVNKPTRGNNILDVILTNLGRYYCEPVIIPPVNPDNPATAVPSDHMGIIAKPRLNSAQIKQKTRITIRPLPSSLIEVFGSRLSQLNFGFAPEMNSTELVGAFQDQLEGLVSVTFPQKSIIISSEDKPFFTEELRNLKRRRMREYTKHGKSNKYFELKEIFENKMKSELEKYKQKIIDEVSDGKRGSTYPALKKLGLRPGTEKQTWFQLPSHTEQQLSSAQSAELIADHFCHISQEFSPLSVTQLPPNIQHSKRDSVDTTELCT